MSRNELFRLKPPTSRPETSARISCHNPFKAHNLPLYRLKPPAFRAQTSRVSKL